MEKTSLVTIIGFNLVVFIIAFIIVLIYYGKEFPKIHQTISTKQVDLIKNNDLSQEFNNINRLSLIEIRLKNSGRLNQDKLKLAILDSHNNELKQLIINGTNIGDDEWVKFKILPPLELKGQKSILLLSSDTLRPDHPIQVFEDNNMLWNYLVSEKENYLDLVLSTIKVTLNRFNSDIKFATFYYILTLSLIILLYKSTKNYTNYV